MELGRVDAGAGYAAPNGSFTDLSGCNISLSYIDGRQSIVWCTYSLCCGVTYAIVWWSVVRWGTRCGVVAAVHSRVRNGNNSLDE
jgi:hypothetical protein